jgi:hypothetical protein
VYFHRIATQPNVPSSPKSPLLHRPQREIQQPTQEKRNLKSNVTRLLSDRPYIPYLRHPGHHEAHAQHHRAERCNARWEETGGVPGGGDIVVGEGGASEVEVLDEHDSGEGGGPVPNDGEEVGEGVVESVGTRYGEWQDAGGVVDEHDMIS